MALPAAPIITPEFSETAGFVRAIDTRAIGLAVVALGGGRARAADAIDPSVGLTQLAGIGDAVSSERPLALVHARTSEQAAAAARILATAYNVGDERPKTHSPIIATIAAPKP